MGWMQKLYETYGQCSGATQFEKQPLPPVGHTTQQAHIEIVIDHEGNFKRAAVISKGDDTTLIPCTEESGGRAGSKPINHPLCDKLQYLAGDFIRYGGEVTSGYAKTSLHDPSEPHQLFLNSLTGWADSKFSHTKLQAILSYAKKSQVICDLVKEGILITDNEGRLLKSWTGDKDKAPAIFKRISNGQSPEDAFVRWHVQIPDDPNTATWNDPDLIKAWIGYYASQQSKTGICLVNGTTETLAVQHPAKIRNAGDKAKLVSSNDTNGYTFKGRFLDADQAAGVSFDVTQKAHNALRWLIDRQGNRNGDQAIVSWSVAGKPIPDPFQNSLQLILGGEDEYPTEKVEANVDSGDVGQADALRLNRAINGYRAQLDPTDDIIVMGLDAATPGRMAITFYRELKGSEFLDRIQVWHTQYAWSQNFGKDSHFVGAPAPRDIAEAAYGRRLDDKLRKAAVERLLPCIIDSQPLPVDLMHSTIRRTSNRLGLEHCEWEKYLGIACALFKGYSLSHQKEKYSMALEENRTTRDYLYGRLLAIAENIEHYALNRAGQVRDTSAAKLMQRFADRPFSTWRNIELALTPYKSQLRSSEKGAGFLYRRDELMDKVQSAFQSEDFIDDTPLTGEFLLGYHCQRQELWKKHETFDTPNNEENSATSEE